MNLAYAALWQQAAAQGISVVVAAGDSGAAGCDSPSAARAVNGMVVNGLASSPFHVVAGGTEFDDSDAQQGFWNGTPDAHLSTARKYIPEAAWNDSATRLNLDAGGGGVSQLYESPAWQAAPGVPAEDPGASGQHHRYMPDVSLAASPREGYAIMQGGTLKVVGGTSAVAPAFAGVLALVNQFTGGRNGNPNFHLYPLAAQFPSAFHDVATGSNAVPCTPGSSSCEIVQPGDMEGHTQGYDAGRGYDLATGLGSIDAYNLVTNWSKVVMPPAIISASPNPLTGSNSRQMVTVSGTGFRPDSGIAVLVDGAKDPNTQVVPISDTEIRVSTIAGVAGESDWMRPEDG
jgi:subtilase family serine protease